MRNSYQVQKEVAQKSCFEGEIALSELKRIVELLQLDDTCADGRNIALNFEFLRSEFDVPILAGRLQTSLELECQRCLKPLELQMDVDFRLLIDANDELLSQISEDTLYSDEGYIDIAEVVEDELILAIPLVAMHEDTACNENWRASELPTETPGKENPFAVLQQLKTTD